MKLDKKQWNHPEDTVELRALKMVCECILRQEGVTEIGLRAYLPSVVNKFLGMAAGDRPCYFNMTTKPVRRPARRRDMKTKTSDGYSLLTSQAAEPVIRFLPARRRPLADIAGIEIPRGMDIDELASEFAPREE